MKRFLILLAVVASGWLIAQNSDGFGPEELAVTAPTVTTGGAPVPDLLFWPLNEGSGTDITGDSSLGGDDGTTDAAWVTGWDGSGSALDFNGTDDDAATDAALTYSTNKITVKFKLFLDATNATAVVVESSSNFTSTDNAWVLLLVDDGTFAVSIHRTGAAYRNESFLSPPTGSWISITALFDYSTEDGNTKLWYDSVEQTELAISPNNLVGPGTFGAQTLYVGARAGTSLFYNGRIDELQIWKGDVAP